MGLHQLKEKLTNVLLVVASLILLITPIVSVAATATTTSTTISTVTPIKHLVVIFQENVAFDHYFATYPNAANPPSEPAFSHSPSTPSINGLTVGLLTNNTNLANPFRLDRSQSVIVTSCNPAHKYTLLQKSFDRGLMDKFVQNSGLSSQKNCDPKLVMGYFDGNTVTALWNYAQHFAISDNFYSSNIDPSLPGHLNIISGQTHGAMPTNMSCYVANGTAYQDRCGYGARLPMLAISPYAKVNFVDHSVTDQSSILRFIEDNWNLGPYWRSII
jgi:phospholipase C